MVAAIKRRWGRARDQLLLAAYVKHLSKIIITLKKSKTLDLKVQGIDPKERPSNSSYLNKLREGVKHYGKGIAFEVSAETKKEVEEAQKILASGVVVQTVEDEAELANVEYWQQGDASLATEEKMAQRQALRYDRHVKEALQGLWEAAQRSLQSGGDVGADELHREGHAIMLRRVYRLMIKDFDPVDCEKCIADDWERDTRGKGHLSRKYFGDAFFELADTWVRETRLPCNALATLKACSFCWLGLLFWASCDVVSQADGALRVTIVGLGSRMPHRRRPVSMASNMPPSYGASLKR